MERSFFDTSNCAIINIVNFDLYIKSKNLENVTFFKLIGELITCNVLAVMVYLIQILLLANFVVEGFPSEILR